MEPERYTYLNNLQQTPATQQLSSVTPQIRHDMNSTHTQQPALEPTVRRKDNYYRGNQIEPRPSEIPRSNVLLSDNIVSQNQLYELSDSRKLGDLNVPSFVGKTKPSSPVDHGITTKRRKESSPDVSPNDESSRQEEGAVSMSGIETAAGSNGTINV